MTKPPDAGYEGPGDTQDEELSNVIFELESYTHQYAASGLYCRILRNEEAIGMVRVASEREFRWLKARVDSVLPPGDVP
jgi:hypothetical protein